MNIDEKPCSYTSAFDKVSVMNNNSQKQEVSDSLSEVMHKEKSLCIEKSSMRQDKFKHIYFELQIASIRHYGVPYESISCGF